MSVRKVVTRSGRRIMGFFRSQKCCQMINCESLLERDAILLLEFSQEVVFYRHQPTVMAYTDGEQNAQIRHPLSGHTANHQIV